MKRFSKKAMVIGLIFILISSCIPGGLCDSGMEEYQPAMLDIKISFPRSWYYGDRSITDDNIFCRKLEISAEEFTKQYLYADTYVVAYDLWSDTFMALDVDDTNYADYSEMTDGQIQAISDSRYDWLENDKLYSTVYKGVVNLNRPFYKLVTKNIIKKYFFYLTIHGGKKYFFEFSLPKENAIEAYEEIFDDIIESITFSE